MPDREEKFWFHAKSYGYGWGLPASWQGWLTLSLYLVVVLAIVRFVPGNARLAAMMAITVMLIVIVVFKGEKPAKWRWGKD